MTLRFNKEADELIRRAADLVDKPLTVFGRDAVIKDARAVLGLID